MDLGLPLEPTLSGFLPSATEPLKLLEVFPVLGSGRLTGPWASSLPQSCRQTQSESRPSWGRLWVRAFLPVQGKGWGGGRTGVSHGPGVGAEAPAQPDGLRTGDRAPLLSVRGSLRPRQLTERTCVRETTPGSGSGTKVCPTP